jgi:hypothetical protein
MSLIGAWQQFLPYWVKLNIEGKTATVTLHQPSRLDIMLFAGQTGRQCRIQTVLACRALRLVYRPNSNIAAFSRNKTSEFINYTGIFI